MNFNWVRNEPNGIRIGYCPRKTFSVSSRCTQRERERERERNQVPFVLLLFFFVFFLWFEELSMILFSQTKPFMAADGGFGFASIKKSKDNKDNDDDDDDDDDGN